MAFKLPSHLHRSRSGVLHFRIAIPPDVRHHFSTKEIYRSLHTANVREAAIQAQALSTAFKHAFNRIRLESMPLNKKNQLGGYDIGLVVEIDLSELMQPTKVKIQTEPHDPPGAAEAALATIFGSGNARPTPAPLKSGQPLSTYIDPYFESIPAEHRPNEKTLASYRAAIDTFIKIVANKPPHELSVQDRNRFEDVIVKLPVNSTKIQTTRGLNIDEVLELGLQPISIQNAKNIARRANVFLEWVCRREGHQVPFKLLEQVRITKKKKGVKKRRAFTDDELRIVFHPATLGVSTQPSPYMFWVPLIGVHTGMRINEIAQLDLADLIIRDGIPCFNVTDLPDLEEEAELVEVSGKSVKTEAAKRLVPIHQRLIELGLLEYAKVLRAAGHTRLFPDLTGGRDGPGQPASKQFGRYCDRIGLTDLKLVFHSFRHGAVGRMRSQRVHKELRKVVIGHSLLEETHDDYGDIVNDYSARDKQEAIEALRFDDIIDYAALKTKVPSLADLNRALARNLRRSSAKAVEKKSIPT
ncbi:site-specific integrase [Oxalobacteraceae bacterium R-40]|uniref:Site-specific integrase n=1 Tax=Keguizhuia sedimenti TaxID=3064264 RepID=A0ABU1BSD3_9BURK|nr:site-specific integrase [Oxalobacteraceae bacterium R-40]